MGWSLQELRERMSAEELVEWQAYERVEPWGERRQDLRAGRMMALVGNLLAPLGGLLPPRGRLWRADDFYPPVEPPPPPSARSAPATAQRGAASRPQQTPQQMQAVLETVMGLTRQVAGR